MIYLVESFLSFQGEGRYIGKPSIFLRFGGCNLACKGFEVEFKSTNGTKKIGCDSFFAVDKEVFINKWECFENSHELFEKVLFFIKGISYLPNIVITGGEPLIYFKNAVFYDFVRKLLDFGFKINVETNASIRIDFKKYPIYKNLIYAMSVKLSNSGEDYKKRVNKEAIKAICENSKKSFFKFVLNRKMLIKNIAKNEIEDIVEHSKNEIFCMPMGENSIELSKNDKKVAEFCIKNGYTYTDRVHIRLWNDKKGV